MRKRVMGLLLVLSSLNVWAGEVVWFDGRQPVSYCLQGRVSPVVVSALQMFDDDMQQVTGVGTKASKDGTIQVWQLDKNPKEASRLLKQGVLADKLSAKTDGFWIGTRGGKIFVVGNNGRGTAYGLLELSRMAGVSPWVWWGDVVPERKSRLTLNGDFETMQAPSVAFRGIFINDEDWSLRAWSKKTFEPLQPMGPKTYKQIFRLLLRLRANAMWPGMHDGTPAFFTVKGNKEMADSFGILIGSSHCEPLLRNNVAEWSVKERGAYNYMTNRAAVKQYWTERLRQVAGSEELFTIGMRGIHDGSMEGVKTKEEKLQGLQQVIDDQRELLKKYINKDVTKVPQVFIPYKEVLEIMESGLRVPDDVTLMWCDDNYGYLTRLADAEQQKRVGGGGVYYHLSYWGRPHDYLWLTSTQPGLVFSEMKAAYDHNARRLWIVNVHDPKVAAYDLELFLDMAWNIESICPQGLYQHMERWLCTQFGEQAGRKLAPVMRELYRLNAVRRPEFMGWTQVELDKRKVPGGKSTVDSTQFTLSEACQRLADFGRLEAAVDAYERLVPERLRDAYYAHVLYPVHASAAMSRKILSEPVESKRAYEEIQSLTARYNQLRQGRWAGLMDASPRKLPVFAEAHARLADDNGTAPCIARNAFDYTQATAGVQRIQMLGHSMNAVSIPKDGSLTYEFDTDVEGEAVLYTAMIPTQPSDKGDLRYSVALDGAAPEVISLKTPYRSEYWKQSVLRGQALKKTNVRVSKGRHTLVIKALDDHIIADQWMLDFQPDRHFYEIPVCEQSSSEQSSTSPTRRRFTVNITPDGKSNMVVYLPQTPSGRAVVGCPGGGYQGLSMQNEGHDWAEWFNEQGIAYFVLTYRMPKGDRTIPMGDAQQAIRTVRDSAQAWGINPKDVGIMGFSAGGHLASTVSTHSEEDCRPDFSILFYPVISMDERVSHKGSCVNFLGAEGQKDEQLVKSFSNQNAVRSGVTPPAIILTANDDRVVPPVTNGIAYYSAMRNCGNDCSLYVYPTGGHGFGFRQKFRYHDQMLGDLKNWLRHITERNKSKKVKK